MRIFLQLTCLSVAVACLTHALLKTPEPTVISTTAHAMPLDFKMKPLYEPSHSEDTVPTTETLIWDCPECCDVGACSGASKALVVSGPASGVMTEEIPGARWVFSSSLPNECFIQLTVECVDGVLRGNYYYVGVGSNPCTAGFGGSGSVSSSDPVLVVFDVPAMTDPLCGCPGGTFTVSE